MNRPAISGRACSTDTDGVPDISEPGFLNGKVCQVITTCGIDGYIVVSGCEPVITVHNLA